MSDRGGQRTRGGWKFAFRALRYRNYRLFFFGQGISFTGTWMHRTALSWLIFRITGSPALLGTVIFASLLPAFVIAPFAGVLADKLDRRKMIMAANSFAALQAFAMAALTYYGLVSPWLIVGLSACLGIAAGFDMPVRQSFVIDMVERKEDLASAIALNSSLYNIARIAGPMLAGTIIAAAGTARKGGEEFCFILNALSYIVAILAFMLIKAKTREGTKTGVPVFTRLKEGFHYTFKFPVIRAIILFMALLSLMGMPYFTLLTVFAKSILEGDARTLGYLSSATGVGALIGAAFLVARGKSPGLERWIPAAAGIFGIAAIAFSLSSYVWLSMLIAPFCGFGILVTMAASNTIVQNVVEEDKRGRLMSFFVMAFMGMASFGSLLSGLIAESIGAPLTLRFCGAMCIAGALVFAGRIPDLGKRIRPILEKAEKPPLPITEMPVKAD